MNSNGIRTLRWAMVGFGAVAGVVLLAAGATLFGAVLLTFAILRLVMLLAMQRRLREWGVSRGDRGSATAGVGNPNRDTMQRLARGELAVAAVAIGVAPDDLRRAVSAGRSIASVAEDAGVPVQQVVDAVVRDATARVERAVSAGNLAPERAERMRTRLPRWSTRFVRTTPAVLTGGGASRSSPPPTR